MSLQVWLPLNGNLNNQGLDTITISGTPTYGPGKLAAQAYNLKNRCTFTVPSLVGAKTWSVAFWYITNTDTSLSSNWVDVLGFTDEKSDNSATGQYRFETCYGSVTNDGISQHDNATYATHNGFEYLVTTFGTWHHICTTIDYENNICIAYVDGIKLKTTTHNGGHLTGSVWLGETNKVNGYLQDVRIYDHALSAKEVKELSKGLVMHLPLDNNGYPRPNLLPHTNIAVYGAGYMASYSSGTIAVDNTELFNGKPTLKIKPSTSTTSSGGNNLYNSAVPLVLNKTYTYSCYIKSTVADTWDHSSLGHYQVYNSSGAHNSSDRVYTETTIPANRWVRVSQKFKCTADGALFRSFFIYFANTSQTIWVADVKLEEGDTATPWVPNSADSDYAGSNIAYDVSGFCNNTTILNLSYSSDTPRYLSSTYFNGDTSQLSCSNTFGNVYNNTYTMSFWIKPESQSGARSIYFGMGDSGLFNVNIEKTTGNVMRYYWGGNPDMTISAVTLPDNEWMHIAIVRSSPTDTKFYKNGVLMYTLTTTCAAHTSHGSLIHIGRDARTGATAYKGLMSDFRFYATALSADDIAELYKVPISIDNTGKVHAIEFNEV